MARSLVERNPVLPVEFFGFQSDTYTLGRCGWRVAIEEREHLYGFERRLMVMCHHERLGLTLIGEAIIERLRPYDFRDASRDPIILSECSMRGGRHAAIIRGQPPKLSWVETQPMVMDLEHREIYDLPLFAQLDEPAGEQLIVEPATVSQLLEQIRRMQAPEQAEIRARDRRRERHETPRLHAQILSIAA